MAKTLWSFGLSECNRVIVMSSLMFTDNAVPGPSVDGHCNSRHCQCICECSNSIRDAIKSGLCLLGLYIIKKELQDFFFFFSTTMSQGMYKI